jgi:hypothetical protein
MNKNPTGGAFEWTEEQNARRCQLIEKQVDGTLTADEARELDRLQQEMRRHVDHIAPLPFDAAMRLHAELLKKRQIRE